MVDLVNLRISPIEEVCPDIREVLHRESSELICALTVVDICNRERSSKCDFGSLAYSAVKVGLVDLYDCPADAMDGYLY